MPVEKITAALFLFVKPRCYGRKYIVCAVGCKYPKRKHTVYSGTLKYTAGILLIFLVEVKIMRKILRLHT